MSDKLKGLTSAPTFPVFQDLPAPPRDGSGGFYSNQWTGYLTPSYFSQTGNWLTFLPLPEGAPAFVGTLLMGLYLKKLAETEKGQALIQHIIKDYLGTVGGVLEELHKSSVASPWVAIMNNYVAVNIYKRLGLMSPNDATQCRAWLDHFLGEALKQQYVAESLTAVSTLVQGSTTKGATAPQAGGLPALLGLLQK